MPLGISTLYLVIQKKPFESVVELLSGPAADRVSYFEIVDNGSTRLTDTTTERLAGLAQTGHRFTLHSPYEGINIASSDPRKRRRSVDAVKESLERGATFDALNVVVHPGTTDAGAPPEEAFRTNCDSLMEIWDHSCSIGQRMAVENDIAHEKGILVRPSDFRSFFASVGTRLPLLLDVGHANISGTLKEFVGKMASDFSELHVHDNEGDWDQHLALGEGNTDLSLIRPLFANTSLLFTVESVQDPFGSFERLSELRREALLI
ncbi:MAG TPA: sugar phosphate isomerase/epimerase family protein [Conexivisphaerales archaeon]|nr:sugar phosphate isomerase/epimerase family protein [Conexivisphaerales archaeon]